MNQEGPRMFNHRSAPNPLEDELSDDAKAELAAVFADMRARLRPQVSLPRERRQRQFWERAGW